MTILIVEDQLEVRYSIKRVLEKTGYRIRESDGSGWQTELERLLERVELVILDVMLGNESGIEILRKLRETHPRLPVILITAYTTPENIIEASRLGAKDILKKPFESEELLTLVSGYKKQRDNDDDFVFYRDEKEGDAFIGSYETMGEVFKKIGLVAANELSVMLSGATGTGKEMVSKMIHRFSPRKGGPFVAINCAAIPHDLFESEFFGHEKGAFTGADKLKIGCIESANGGVLFLDEIGEMPTTLQSKLLRYLENRRFRRVGDTTELQSDVRIICATNINIEKNIQEGAFREDLYYRLAQLTITLPRLRDRLFDLDALCRHFINKANRELGTRVLRVNSEGMKMLRTHGWEGNIREFRNTLFNACLSAHSGEIKPSDIRLHRCNTTQGGEKSIQELIDAWLHREGVEHANELATLFEKLLLTQTLKATGANISQAANALGITRNTLKAKMRQHDLHDQSTTPPINKENLS